MKRSSSDLVDLILVQHHETGAAILVSETGDCTKTVWLPKSSVEVHDTGRTQMEENPKDGYAPRPRPIVEVTGPQWLFTAKGLV